MAKTPLNKRPVQFRPLKDFSIHPAIADDPRLKANDPRYLRMQAAWDEQGGCPPVYATADGKIVDGRHRYWWLEKTEADEVPWIEVDEDEVHTIILGALQGRNNVTKGQQAYLAAPKLEHALKAAQDRRIAILNSGGKAKLPALPNAEALAARLGISEELLRQARRIHEIFTGKNGKTLRKEWEPKILDAEEPLGLGVVLAGIGGSQATKGQKKKPARNSNLAKACSVFRNMTNPFAKWDKWPEDEQNRAKVAMDDAFSKLPDTVLDSMSAAIKAVKRRKADADKLD